MIPPKRLGYDSAALSVNTDNSADPDVAINAKKLGTQPGGQYGGASPNKSASGILSDLPAFTRNRASTSASFATTDSFVARANSSQPRSINSMQVNDTLPRMNRPSLPSGTVRATPVTVVNSSLSISSTNPSELGIIGKRILPPYQLRPVGTRIPTKRELRTVGRRMVDPPGLPPRLRLDNKPLDLDAPSELMPEAVIQRYADPENLPGHAYLKIHAGVMATYGSVRVPLSMAKDYNEARRYIASGPSGRRLLATVENRDVPVQLFPCDLDATAAAQNGAHGLLEIEVRWDPKAALATSAGGRLPPAEILAHEFGHAIRFLQDRDGRYLNNPLSYLPVPSSSNAHERNVIRASELEISLEHGNIPRDDHLGAHFKTKNVDSTEALFPEDEAVITSVVNASRGITAVFDQRGIDPELVAPDLVKAAHAQISSPEQLGPAENWSDAHLIAGRQALNTALSMMLHANASARSNTGNSAPQN